MPDKPWLKEVFADVKAKVESKPSWAQSEGVKQALKRPQERRETKK